MATFNNFRCSAADKLYTNLEDIVNLAKDVGGPNHGFRYVQLPVNAIMREAAQEKWHTIVDNSDSPLTFLSAAQSLGITVMSSRSINGGKSTKKSLLDFQDCEQNIYDGKITRKCHLFIYCFVWFFFKCKFDLNFCCEKAKT